MPTAPASVFARDDTFFGVCQALGDDFGFGPNWLRAALGVLLLLNPLLALAVYGGAGLVVALSRRLAPEPPQPAPAADAVSAPLGCNDDEAAVERLADAA